MTGIRSAWRMRIVVLFVVNFIHVLQPVVFVFASDYFSSKGEQTGRLFGKLSSLRGLSLLGVFLQLFCEVPLCRREDNRSLKVLYFVKQFPSTP